MTLSTVADSESKYSELAIVFYAKEETGCGDDIILHLIIIYSLIYHKYKP